MKRTVVKARRLSITARTRLWNGLLGAALLTALVVLAQSRIRTVLYDAVDSALRAQAQGMASEIARPRGGPNGPGPNGPRDFGPGGFFGGPGGPESDGRRRENGDPGGQPGGGRPENGPFPRRQLRVRGGPFGGMFDGPREPPPLRFGTTSLLPPRLLKLDKPETRQGNPAWSVDGHATALGGSDNIRAERGADGEPIHVYSTRTDNDVIQTAATLTETEAALSTIRTALMSLILPLALIGGFLGALLADLTLAPVRQLARAAEKLSPGNLSERLPAPGGGDTFDQLVSVLNSLLGRLEGAFDRQRRFTADASHELRTPIAVVKAATSLLLESDEPLTDRQRRALVRADKTADRANALVSDLLLLARADDDRRFVRLAPTDLKSTVADAVADAVAAKPSGNAPHAPVETHFPGPTDAVTDAALVHRLVVNLVGNALRHTPETGKIDVELARASDEIMVLRVADTGVGIAPDAIARLGEPFFRPDEARARDHGGVGLGLALCRAIASALDGTLEIESEVGHGTTVTVRLPQAKPTDS